MVVGFDGAGFASTDERVGEEGGGGVGGGEGGEGGGASRAGGSVWVMRRKGRGVREFLDRLARCGLGTYEERWSQSWLEGVVTLEAARRWAPVGFRPRRI